MLILNSLQRPWPRLHSTLLSQTRNPTSQCPRLHRRVHQTHNRDRIKRSWSRRSNSRCKRCYRWMWRSSLILSSTRSILLTKRGCISKCRFACCTIKTECRWFLSSPLRELIGKRASILIVGLLVGRCPLSVIWICRLSWFPERV